MPIRGKNRSGSSLTLNTPYMAMFLTANLAANENETILGALPIPQASKVLRVAATTSAVSGSPAIQIVSGGGAAGAPGAVDQIAPIGTTIFNAPITVTATALAGQTISPAQMDAVFPSGTVFTLRGNSGAGDTATGLVVALELCAIDEHPQAPQGRAFGPKDF